MPNIDQEYVDDLEQFLASDENEDGPEEEIPQGLEGNVSIEEARDSEQALLYIVVDKSASMRGLQEAVKDSLKYVKQTVNGSKERKIVQTAMTFFGSEVEERPFQYGEKIDTFYEADGSYTRLYDAIVSSCNNMAAQYDSFNSEFKVKGVMLIFTDGGENGSKNYTKEDAAEALKMLAARRIPYYVAALEGIDTVELGKDLNSEVIEIKDEHALRRFMKFVTDKSVT